MVTLTGTLFVSNTTRDGKSLKTASLECELGQFQVNYPHLQSLKEGQHQGFFTIGLIQQCCYNDQGKYCFELEAVIENVGFFINENLAQETSVPASFVEQDSDIQEAVVQTQETPLPLIDNTDDEELFGSLFPLEEKVQLDTSQPRNCLNLQTRRLRELGYRFHTKEQIWYSPDAFLKAA